MAFTAKMTRYHEPAPFGGLIMTSGWYKSDGGSTGGDINTGLLECVSLLLQPHANAVVANAPAVNENFGTDAAMDQPMNGKAVTVVTAANEVGRWVAFGRN